MFKLTCQCFARLDIFVRRCYVTNVEVDVSNVTKEEAFDDHPSLPPGCSIPVVHILGDVLDSSPFPLHDSTPHPIDFEELPVRILFSPLLSLRNAFLLPSSYSLFVMQVLSEGEQHILAATPAHPAGLYGKGGLMVPFVLFALRCAVNT
jgi:hypothetical protein